MTKNIGAQDKEAARTAVKRNEKSAAELKALLQTEFYTWVKDCEAKKILYFAFTYTGKTLVITAPSGSDEQKKFLGYEFSTRRGEEGMTESDGSLTNLHDRNDTGKLAWCVKQAFDGTECSCLEYSDYVSYIRTADMLDFSRPSFDLQLKLTADKHVQIQSKYPLVRLGDIAEVSQGNSAPQNKDLFINGTYPFFRVSDVAREHLTPNLIQVSDYLNEKGIKKMRLFKKGTILFPKSGASTYLDHRAIMGIDGYVVSHLSTIISNLDKILVKFLYEILINVKTRDIKPGSGYPSLNIPDIEDIKIPLPPLDIQQKIVAECEKVDEEYTTAQKTIEENKRKIEKVMSEVKGEMKKIKDLCQSINPSKSEIADFDDKTLVSFVEMASVSNDGYIETKIDKQLSEVKQGSYTYFGENDIILAKITPCMENGKCAIAKELTNKIGFGSSEFHVFRCNNHVLNKYLFGYLNREIIRQEAASKMTGSSGHRRVPISFYENLNVPVPSLEEQERIVQEIEACEAAITASKSVLSACADKKKMILEKWL